VSTTAIVVIVLVLLVAVVLGVVLARRKKSTQLQEHFGPEYERSVSAASGDRKAAETALAERQQRRQEFDVRDLRPEERGRFRESWNEIQRGFVDDPRQSLHSADLLVGEVMRTRGYPVDDDFDRRADDLSVDHPRVVQHYREARRIRDTEDEVDTEQQRTAVTSYRSLIDALLGDDDDRGPDHRAEGTADRATDGTLDDRDRDRDRDGHVPAGTAADDDSPGGRHALRDPDAGRGAHRPDGPHIDPNGTHNPRTTEERTR
jgi:hypothetical protein